MIYLIAEKSTHRYRNKGVLSHDILYSLVVCLIILYVDDLACSLNMTTPMKVIDTCERNALRHVSTPSHIGYTVQRNETARATAKVSYAGNKYSIRAL